MADHSSTERANRCSVASPTWPGVWGVVGGEGGREEDEEREKDMQRERKRRVERERKRKAGR